jgi:thiol-disulfide isomerase/thioredoxin
MQPDKILETLIEKGEWVFPLLSLIVAALLIFAVRFFRARWARWLTSVPLALLVAFTGLGFVFSHRVLAAIDQRTDQLTFARLEDGRTSNIEAYRGQVVLLNYWATWCPPCRAEMPDLNRLAATYKDRGLVVLTVSDEKVEKVEKYRGEQSLEALTFGIFEDEKPKDWISKQAYAGRPTTVLIDREGNVRRLLIGGQSYERFEQSILPLL